MRNWWNKYYPIIILLVIAAIMAGLIGWFLLTLKNEPGWAQSYTAVGTLVLAFFTLVLALATFGVIWQNYRFKEKDKKEKLLNEILEWIRGLEVKIFPYPYKGSIQILEEIYRHHELGISGASGEIMKTVDKDLRYSGILDIIVNDCKYMKRIAFRLDDKLFEMIDSLEGQLNNRLKLIYDTFSIRTEVGIKRTKMYDEAKRLLIEGENPSDILQLAHEISDGTTKMFADNASRIRDLIFKSIDKSIDLKINI